MSTYHASTEGERTELAPDYDVVVVGGGLAGLAAGATSSAAGARTIVLDSQSGEPGAPAGPGGRARITERDGFTFNLGAHALYVKGAGWEALRRLGVQPSGAKPPLRDYRLRQAGRLHLLPSGPSSLVGTSAVRGRGKAQAMGVLAGLLTRRAAKYAAVSAEDWLVDQRLRPDAAAMLRALMRIGTYSARLDELSAEAAIGQLQAGARHGVVYLHGGWGQLTSGLAARTSVRGGYRVDSIEPERQRLTVTVSSGGEQTALTAGAVVVAAGTPVASRALLGDPGWGDLGEPLTAACLDVAVRRVPEPGYVLGVDEPLYVTTQSPPARQAPDGQAVVSVLRYGATRAADDRQALESYLAHAGVRAGDVLFSRFLARMVVTGAQPLARLGGFRGRPTIDATGISGVFLAGDWVGPRGLLADAALASGYEAGAAAAARAAAGRSGRRVGVAG